MPAIVYSFDPGGLKSIQPHIGANKVVPFTEFEKENSKHPTAWDAFERAYAEHKKLGFFKEVGTFVIDSLTMMAEALMNKLVKRAIKGDRTPGVPILQDWMIQMITLQNVLKEVTSLPCDVLITAHNDIDKDEVTGKISAGPMVTGKLKARLPIIFDELWVAIAKGTAKGSEYSLLTQNDGYWKARTRLGFKGRFEKFERPDIKYLLKKAGMPFEDLVITSN